MEITLGKAVFALCILSRAVGKIDQPLKMGSWNLQRFGPAKASNVQKLDVIVQVVRRYDIILLLEVKDTTGRAMTTLLNKVNQGQTDQYNAVISERVGRSRHKEQYAFLYKQSRTAVTSTNQPGDTDKDVFSYDPFIVTFSVAAKGLSQLAILALHAKPSSAEKELDKLVDVYDQFKANTGLEDMLIMGDLNAGCDYVTSTEWPKIRLKTESRFTWLISDHEDTTTKYTTCPYDRLIVVGDKLRAAVYMDSARAFYFDEEYNLNSKLTYSITDHYPVEVSLRPYVDPSISQHVKAYSSVVVTDVRQATGVVNFASSVWKSNSCNLGGLATAQWEVTSLSNAKETLANIRATHPGILSNEAFDVLTWKLDNGALTDSSVHGESQAKETYLVEIVCDIVTKYCSATVRKTTPIS